MLQFDCCGIANATDWFRLNPGAVEATNGFPGCPTCEPGEEGCFGFAVPDGINVNDDELFTVEQVRSQACLLHWTDWQLPGVCCIGASVVIKNDLKVFIFSTQA